MRPTVSPAIPLCLCLAFATPVFAQSGAPIDVKSMLAGLQQIKQKAADSAHSQLVQTISDFSAASGDDGSAFNFYCEAVRVTRFVGQPREQTAFHEWRQGVASKLNPAVIRTALRYTTLSLQRASGATDDQIFGPLLAYAQEAAGAIPTSDAGPRGRGGDDIINEPVGSNIFAKWYNIGDKLGSLENWEQVPGNIEGIYSKVLLPVMRKNRDPRIIQYWDDKLANETAAASAATAAFSTDRFNQTRRPQILWNRAEDEIAIGQRDQGITEMYQLVKSYPSHPSAGKWIEELQGLLAPAAPTSASASAPAPAAVASAPAAASSYAPAVASAAATPIPGSVGASAPAPDGTPIPGSVGSSVPATAH